MPAQRTETLRNKHGLHARPISQIVAAAQDFHAELTVSCQGRTASGRSVLEMMTLGAGPGATIELSADGDDAEAMLDALCLIIRGNFGED